MLRPSINIVPVYTKSVCDLGHPSSLLSESLVPALETALESCVDQSRAKVLLVTNAHNPFAQCYPERILREAIEWCAEKGMHYISDEVYALSDFSRTGPAAPINGNGDVGSHEVLTPPSDGTTTPDAVRGDGARKPKPQPDNTDACFTSALSINLDANKTPPVSVIWSTSKDLGSSGLRVGVHVLRPPPPHPPSPPKAQKDSDADDTNPNTPSPPPNPPAGSPPPPATPQAQASLLTTSLALLSTTQLPTISMLLTRSLLTSPSFDALVATNRQRLRASHDIITRRLREWGVAFIPATSGPFLVANLGVARSKAGLDGGGDAGFESRRRVANSHGGVGVVGDVDVAVLGGGKRRRGSEEGGGGDVPGAKRQRVAPPSAVEDGVNVVEVLRRKAMVLVSPAKGFHMRGAGPGQALDEGWVRITFAVPLDVLEAALKRIGDALGFEKSKTMVGQVEIM
jgi:aspartate/methionine/tyrosine aminotransferase